jgi:hypothetical protein
MAVRISTWILSLWILPSGFGQSAEPVLPFYDRGACPYERCRYGDPWTVQRPVTVYDTWTEGRRAVAQLVAGDKATGIAGVVITFRPGVIRMDRDLPDQDLRRGDFILTYAHRGEGFSAVWFKGKYRPDFDLTFTKWPDGSGCGNGHCAATSLDPGKKVWWAEVKLASGKTGWVDMGVDKMPVAMF